MKRMLVMLLALCLALSWVVPAQAGAKAVGRWEGLAIGLGAVSLYNLFSYGAFTPVVPPYAAPAMVYQAPPVIYQVPPVVYEQPPMGCPPPAYYDEGPPGYGYGGPERVWVPGHWERHHRWTPGHWEWY